VALTFFTRWDYKFGYLPTTDFDGSDVNSQTIDQLRIPNIEIKPAVDVIQRDASVGYRQADDDDAQATECGMDHLITIPPWEVHRTQIAELFRMAMQDASEAAATPYSKLIFPHSTQPDFAGESGQLCHLLAEHPGTSSSFLACGCLLKELNVSISMDTPGRRLTVGGTFLARRVEDAYEPTGHSWSSPAQNYFTLCNIKSSDNGAITLAGEDVNFYGLDFTFTNNGRGLGIGASGYWQDYTTGPYACEGTLRILRNPTVDAPTTGVIDAWRAGTISTFIIQWQTSATFGATAGDLRITIPMLFTNVEIDRTHEEIFNISFSTVKTSSYDVLKFEVADGQDLSW
jgi:hypothetical protein